ncbi:unnamed protein product [Rotaria sp. Silwood1]|nr:unnamed protein product [Rotaria sp. Silwood1]
MCLILLHTICILANIILFGRLTGIFATESFGDACDYQHQNLIAPIKNNNTYSQGTELITFNNDSSYKLRHKIDVALLSTIATSMPSFREKVMNIVHWLFMIGAVEFLVSSIENFVWIISVKRQTFRMGVSLFRSLVQRVSQIYFHLQKKSVPKV